MTDPAFRRKILGVAILSAATLLLETTLTRLLAVAQFYHFAFLVISLALLGFGASGTLLSVIPKLREAPLDRVLAYLGTGFVGSVALAYGVINFLPFDSYAIAWDRRQIFLFALYYLVLMLPFVISGLGVGSALSRGERTNHLFYAANLLGSGLGASLAPFVLYLAGVPGAVLFSAVLGLAVTLIIQRKKLTSKIGVQWLLTALFFSGIVIYVFFSNLNLQSRAPLGMAISPYKGLAQARRYQDSRVVYERWNAISRIDVLADAGTHQLPGLSYLYPDLPPNQLGLSLDADALQAITLIQPSDFDAASYLPESLAFDIIPGADTLVLEPGGGLGVLQALTGEAERITAVVHNPLTLQAVASASPDSNVYAHPKVRTITESDRIYLQRTQDPFDIIFLPLTDPFRPVSSGAYSLAEDYSLTVEAFQSILSHLEPGGIFVFTRWMQIPPSESLRAIAVVVDALQDVADITPADALVVLRGIQTVTVMARPAGWTADELDKARAFAKDRKFDLVWLPDIEEEEANQFNRLPEADFYIAAREMLFADDRSIFYAEYPYQISPPTDNTPFFFHFFTWEQTPEVLAALGHTWQPFGGSGYFLLLALLILTLLLSLGLILLPLLWGRRKRKQIPTQISLWQLVIYFGLLGIAFLFVEIPLIQRWILLLGHPTYAFTCVVAGILCFSGIGSTISRAAWLPRRVAFGLLLLFSLSMPLAISQLSGFLLSLPVWGRWVLSILGLAPLGIMMGLPFPLGIALLEKRTHDWIPLAWAVNGCTSVIASVLAAILALSYGFTIVLLLGAGAYAGAGVLYFGMKKALEVQG